MLTQIRRRLNADEGITLVEMLVAFAILSIVLTALASVLITSLRAVVSSESRLRATQLANEVLEELQASDWDELASYPANAVVTRGSTTYDVTTVVSWIDVPEAAGTENYRQFDVAVSWQQLGATRTVSKTATRAPLPEDEDAPLFGLREATVTPNAGYIRATDGRLEKDGEGNGVTQVTLRAVTTTPLDADSVWITFENRYGETVTPVYMTGSNGNTVWTFSSSSWRFPNGDTPFRITAQSGVDSADVVVVASYVHEILAVLELDAYWQESDAGDDPERELREYVCVNEDGTAAEDIVIRAGFRGLTSDDAVTIDGGGLATEEMFVAGSLRVPEDDGGVLKDALVGTVFEYLVEEGHQFPVGATDITFTVIGERGLDEVVGPAGGEALTLEARDAALDPGCAA